MHRERQLTPFLALIFLVGGFVLLAGPSFAKPPVEWELAAIDLGVPPGEELRTEVVAHIRNGIERSILEVTPSLAPYLVSIQPAVLPASSAGDEVVVELRLAVPNQESFAEIEGTLHIREERAGRGKGRGRTHARPLPITLIIGNLLYPPDPGPRGDESLDGVDSDGDNVRDDIQRYIALTYPDQPAVRAGLRQYATHLQEALLEASNSQAALDNDTQISLARECLTGILSLDEGYRAFSTLLAEALNTDVRSRAYILFDGQLSGHYFAGAINENPIDSCAFDPTSLEEVN